MTTELGLAIDGLAELWPKLTTATGVRGAGQPSHKSRPPATLSVVALVMEITTAAREGAEEVGMTYRDPLRNLRVVEFTLRSESDTDLTQWWLESVHDWTRRARVLLGFEPVLPHQQYGAKCPYCSATVATIRDAGETWKVPAIGVTWAEQPFETWCVQSVFCRACGAEWTRGTDLDQLVSMMLRDQMVDVLGESAGSC